MTQQWGLRSCVTSCATCKFKTVLMPSMETNDLLTGKKKEERETDREDHKGQPLHTNQT